MRLFGDVRNLYCEDCDEHVHMIVGDWVAHCKTDKHMERVGRKTHLVDWAVAEQAVDRAWENHKP